MKQETKVELDRMQFQQNVQTEEIKLLKTRVQALETKKRKN